MKLKNIPMKNNEYLAGNIQDNLGLICHSGLDPESRTVPAPDKKIRGQAPTGNHDEYLDSRFRGNDSLRINVKKRWIHCIRNLVMVFGVFIFSILTCLLTDIYAETVQLTIIHSNHVNGHLFPCPT